ncbi:MAG: alanine racemase, partial [Cyclobacteriaceae bacterium]|nr:alanine racemase [Cyclobacteriaceae bacterium]
MWFEIENPDEILSPALLFYPDRIKDNLNQMIQVAGTSDRLRPHVKSHKSPELIGLQMKSGITKFKCATLEEARMVASCHAEDVLLAMPLSGPAQKGFFQLMEQYPHVRFSVLVDHPSQLAQWQALLKPLSHQLSVFIDIDAGMERTGIKPEKALRLLDQVLDEKIFHFAGLHVYDGHIHDTDYKQRVATCEQAFAPIDNLIKSIEATHGQ